MIDDIDTVPPLPMEDVDDVALDDRDNNNGGNDDVGMAVPGAVAVACRVTGCSPTECLSEHVPDGATAGAVAGAVDDGAVVVLPRERAGEMITRTVCSGADMPALMLCCQKEP